jgi:acyl-CoA thioester hydrolase|tara:strand:+ start:55 stop:462 length:408 start_codon:yes stop_codon:yes gene_type:complete
MDYKVEFEVRDNEIDIQGVVNNANYFIYMAHARHKFLKEILAIDFIDMAKANQNLFLISSKIDFKKPLLPNDKFYITCKLIPEGRVRFIFEQEVRLSSNDSLIAKGVNIGVCMDGNRNRPYIPEAIEEYLRELKE